MQLIELNINNNLVNFIDQPDGLDKIQIGYDRDTPYNGFKIEAKATLTFYCGSGYNALKAEYERAFVDGIGYLIIAESCNGVETSFRFKLDFAKYKQTNDTIQIGLIEDNAVGDLKDLLEVEKEIPETDAENVYVRNIDIRYLYHANKSFLKDQPYKNDGEPYAVSWNFYSPTNNGGILGSGINAETETTVNEVEEGFTLSGGYVTLLGTSDYINITSGTKIIKLSPTANEINPSNIYIPAIQPQPIFTNNLEDCKIKFETAGSTDLLISSLNGINFLGKIYNFKEIITIGKTYDSPKYTKVLTLSGTWDKVVNPLTNGLLNIPLINFSSPTATNTIEFNMSKGDNVWIQYSFDLVSISFAPEVVNFPNTDPNASGTVFTPDKQKDVLINYVSTTDNSIWIWDPTIPNPIPQPSGQYKKQVRPLISGLVWEYNDIGIDINRSIDIEVTTNKKTNTGVFNNINDVIFGSTEITAYKASIIANNLFPSLSYNELESPKYNDLYLTRGDILRNRAGRDKFRLNASKFFTELEKMSGVGLGVFYNSSLIPSYRLAVIEEFYTHNVFKTYSIEYDDVTILVAENMLYKGIEIGYMEFKESFDELHGKNTYQIEGVAKGKSTYQKVCEWVASKFIIKRVLNLGSGSESEDLDQNLFILSIDSNKATISDNSSGATIGKDLVFEQNESNVRGLNRKYASLYNLKRHVLKWGFGIHKGKTDLSTQKNDANIKEIRYNDGIGYINLPNFVRASNDITINDIDVEDKLIPHYLEFSIVMNITEFSELRKNWYDMIQLNVDSDTYFGNIVSVDWSEGVAKFKLIGRIN